MIFIPLMTPNKKNFEIPLKKHEFCGRELHKQTNRHNFAI